MFAGDYRSLARSREGAGEAATGSHADRGGGRLLLKLIPTRSGHPRTACVERKLRDGAKLPRRGMKSASWQVGAAPLTPDSCFPATVWGQGDRQRGSFPAEPSPPQGPAYPDRVSVACAISNSVSPAKPLLGGVSGEGPGTAHGFGVPQRSRSGAAGGWAGWRGSGARRSAPASLPSLTPPRLGRIS